MPKAILFQCKPGILITNLLLSFIELFKNFCIFISGAFVTVSENWHKKGSTFIDKYPHCPQSPFASASTDHKLCVGVCFGADFRKKGQWRRNGKSTFQSHQQKERRKKSNQSPLRKLWRIMLVICFILFPYRLFPLFFAWFVLILQKIFRPIASDVGYESLQKQTHKSIWQDTIHHLAKQKFCEGRKWKI